MAVIERLAGAVATQDIEGQHQRTNSPLILVPIDDIVALRDGDEQPGRGVEQRIEPGPVRRSDGIRYNRRVPKRRSASATTVPPFAMNVGEVNA